MLHFTKTLPVSIGLFSSDCVIYKDGGAFIYLLSLGDVSQTSRASLRLNLAISRTLEEKNASLD